MASFKRYNSITKQWEPIGNIPVVDKSLTNSDIPADAKAVGDKIGDMTGLTTNSKTNLVSAINEVKTVAEESSDIISQPEPPEDKTKIWLDTDDDVNIETIGIDKTLSMPDMAADAKAVGDRFKTAVLYTPQELSEEQKKIARDNIGVTGQGGGGITVEQANALDDMFKVCAFTKPDISAEYKAFQKAFGLGAPVPATKVTLAPTSLKFISGVSQSIQATVEPPNTTDKLVWSTNAPGVASVQGGVVNPVGNGDAIITATAGSASATCAVNVNIASIKKFKVTNNLTGCVSDNQTTEVVEGSAYTAKITASEGYTMDSATVTILMGNMDVSDFYVDGIINVPNVIGNIVITIVANEIIEGQVEYLDWIGNNKADAYIDTEYVVRSKGEKYLLGYQYYNPNEATFPSDMRPENRGIMGVLADSYIKAWSINACIGDTDYKVNFVFGNASNYLITGQDNYDSGKPNLKMNEKPFYLYLENKNQALFLDENMTQKPTGGTFAHIKSSVENTADRDPAPFSLIIGGLYRQNIGKVFINPAKFKCFKVWSEVGELIVDMRPAKKNSDIGMYDRVRNKFFKSKGTGSFEYGTVVK